MEGTELRAIAATSAFAPIVGNESRGVIEKRARGAYLYAGGIGTVHARAAGKQPVQVSIALYFPELHLEPGLGGEVFGILVTTSVGSYLPLALVPLLACYLAAAASRALGCIVQNRFICHRLPPELY
jgi:hypothetical protein